jgi:hypothetical protein
MPEQHSGLHFRFERREKMVHGSQFTVHGKGREKKFTVHSSQFTVKAGEAEDGSQFTVHGSR